MKNTKHTKHTSGPWHLKHDVIRSERGDAMAFVALPDGADARLMASAPELLAEAQTALKSLEWAIMVIRDIPENSTFMDNVRNLRAVIAKATGN